MPKNLSPIRWSEVAAEKGVAIGEHTKFSDLVTFVEGKSAEPGDILSPLEETPTGAMVDAVKDAVVSLGDEQQDCIVAVWDGFGSQEISELEQSNAAKIHGMGQQGHFVLSAHLRTVMNKWRSLLPDEPVSASSVASLSPQAIWPSSAEWFCAMPFDWHSMFFAGPTQLIERLLNDERIESYPVSIDADYRHESQKDRLIDSWSYSNPNDRG